MSEPAQQGARLFKTGATLITETAEMRALSVSQVQALLKHSYPELAHATVRETPQSDGTMLVEWLPAAGKKG